jgi:predicted flap endonuclease-1-like 5' DNA nuclease
MTTITQQDPRLYLAIAVVVVIVVILIMRAVGRSKIASLTAAVAHAEGERDALKAERDRLLTDLDTARAQIRPLSDEVDRLKRAEAKRLAVAAPDAAPLVVTETEGSDPGLLQLKGVGDKFAAKLRDLGIDSIRQIAGWSSADAAVIDSQLGPFQGRVMRDRLVEQAKLLHEGRITEYETRFGKLGAP